MTPRKLKRAVREELALLVRQEVLTAAQFEALRVRYPTGRWDVFTLGRWALVFGAISTAVGAGFLFQRFLGFNLQTGSAVLAASIGFLLFLGQLSRRKRRVLTARALERRPRTIAIPSPPGRASHSSISRARRRSPVCG